MKKLKDIKDYCEYMGTLENYRKDNFDYSKCSECGGTGVIGVCCCSGLDCACHGQPIDFLLHCYKCNVNAPEEI